MLLRPTPWIGKTRTRPLILYGPTKLSGAPLQANKYFPSGFTWKPLFWIIDVYVTAMFQFSIWNKQSRNVSYSTLKNWCCDNPIKSESVNFNSILTGLLAPCLILMLGICSGSIGIKLMPLCPSTEKNRKLSNKCLSATFNICTSSAT